MGVDSRARISSTVYCIIFSTSEYVSDMLHAKVVDESTMRTGGRGAEFSLLLGCDYGRHPPVGGSELESEPAGVRARLLRVYGKAF
jgi:hypothetical protein